MDPMAEEIRLKAHQKLEENGKRDELKKLLHNRLTESQFNEKITDMCKNYIKDKNIETLTVDELVNNITPEARKLVPDSVRKELLTTIKQIISEGEPINIGDQD